MEKGKDFYLDDSGLMVLTEDFLRRRGRCCRGGCRHCPYGFGLEQRDPRKDGESNSFNSKGDGT